MNGQQRHNYHRHNRHQQQHEPAADGQRRKSPPAGRDPAARGFPDQRPQPERKRGTEPKPGEHDQQQQQQQRRWRWQPPKRQHGSPSPALVTSPVHSSADADRAKGRPSPIVVELSDDDALTAALVADGYQLGSTIGHGSYSKVRAAMCTRPDRGEVGQVACKVINKMREANSSYVHKFLPRELQVLCSIRHPNVVRTHRIYVTPSTVHVFMDYCEYGDLLNHLQNSRGIPLWQAHAFFK